MSDENFYNDIIIEEKILPADDITIECEDFNLNYTNSNIVNISESCSSSCGPPKNEGKKDFKCKCGKIYTSLVYFTKHEKICQKIQNQDLIVCRRLSCHQTFNNQTDYEKHKISRVCKKKKNYKKLKKGIYSCNFEGCSQKFDTPGKQNTHNHAVHLQLANDTSDPKFSCHYCDLVFKEKNQKERHEVVVHKKRSTKRYVKKVKKSQDFKEKYKSKLKQPKSEKFELKKAITQESDDLNKKRVTRSQNKTINFGKFFEEEKEIRPNEIYDKIDENSSDSNSSKHNDSSSSNTSFDEIQDEKPHTNSSNSEKKDFTKNSIKYICEYENCDKVFSKNTNYNTHIDRVHLKIRCNYQKNAKKQHDYERKLCFLCRKRFKLKKDLVDHMKLPHKIKCSKCSMIFVETSQLEKHTALVHPDSNLKKFQCSKCPQIFATNNYLDNHDRAVHLKKFQTCPFCLDKISAYNLKNHFEAHKTPATGVKIRKKFCEVCQIYLANIEKLVQHKKTEIHLRKISAEFKEFQSMDNSEEYILPDDVHSIDSIWAQIVNENKTNRTKDKGIVNPENLDKMKSNTKTAIRTCSECGLKFRNNAYWKRHMESKHGQEKPLIYCEICDLTFVRIASLYIHLKKSKSHKRKELEAKSLNL